MENKIVTPIDAVQIAGQLHKDRKRIVIAGGCFDIIHKGHVLFLKKARKLGDILMLLLESDRKIKKLKGAGRPINTQKDRALILSSLTYVDYVILLSDIQTDETYDQMISQLKPAIIATTEGDPDRFHKERQAKHLQIKLIDIEKVNDQATSKISKLLSKEL